VLDRIEPLDRCEEKVRLGVRHPRDEPEEVPIPRDCMGKLVIEIRIPLALEFSEPPVSDRHLLEVGFG
jgi:hypothetical protein